jgi:hypothetical protein
MCQYQLKQCFPPPNQNDSPDLSMRVLMTSAIVVASQCPAGKLQFTIGDLSSNDGDDIRAAASAKALVNGSTSLCAEIPSAALGDEREVCLISL